MLSSYEKLINSAEQDGIWVDELHKSSVVPIALMEIAGDLAIFIDDTKFDNDRDRRDAFSHEVGHCKTGAFYNDGSTKIDFDRAEYRADKYAFESLVPFEFYKQAVLSHCRTDCEFAGFWEVPQHQVQKIHNMYERTRYDDVQNLRRIASPMG